MSNLPVEFNTTDIVTNTTLHLSFSFDTISAIQSQGVNMPFNQDYFIPCHQLNLEGKTANPNMSLSIDSVTKLFTLQSCYLTKIYPHIVNQEITRCFVIEGYSNDNIDKERLLIYLPMTHTTDTDNKFFTLEKAIISSIINQTIEKVEKGLDLNSFVPSSNPDTDLYTYYKHTDRDDYMFHVIYFKETGLRYTSAITATGYDVPERTTPYTSTLKILNYKATNLPKRNNNMSNSFEDNIYIDCVPVDLETSNQEKYLKFDKKYANYFNDILVYLAYIILLTLVVYGIYYIYIYSSSSAKPPKSLSSPVPAKP